MDKPKKIETEQTKAQFFKVLKKVSKKLPKKSK
jgi:hypothetical protein